MAFGLCPKPFLPTTTAVQSRPYRCSGGPICLGMSLGLMGLVIAFDPLDC